MWIVCVCVWCSIQKHISQCFYTPRVFGANVRNCRFLVFLSRTSHRSYSKNTRMINSTFYYVCVCVCEIPTFHERATVEFIAWLRRNITFNFRYILLNIRGLWRVCVKLPKPSIINWLMRPIQINHTACEKWHKLMDFYLFSNSLTSLDSPISSDVWIGC